MVLTNKSFRPFYFHALRVRRTETRLKIDWALPYQSDSKFQVKGAAFFGEKTHFEVNNV